jgi:hypothetical protein
VEKLEKTSIESIVEQALQDGYLTPAMEAEVGRFVIVPLSYQLKSTWRLIA